MTAHSIREAHVHMGEVAEVVEQRSALPAHLDGRRAGNGEDHRQIMRGEIPQRIVLGVKLAEAELMSARPVSRAGALIIVALWIVAAGLLLWWFWPRSAA